ncbi:ABC-type transport system involved in multi-copper enzyme maturation permease subunit [Allocatelliglobosispora scoriae]|uniref:ABC-type transport system involved in multi-copper enzyme maturation permease subunit n=1 Tax=Allocatelliglobosispora scoriae TaxID=643052 RepID=A0A841BYM1_9ACTN|nr:ABC transporter permease [Allocatelliglobosispora scoriae]MBB5874247.1 ABC-type transport system involved in multi-copper enzyme maturation permease subunit [Allocatelliglobosispora scoriae]
MTSMLLAEWTKLRSVRSTVWTLLPTLVLSPAIAYLAGQGFSAALADRSGVFDPLFATFYSVTLGQLGLAVFGVLAVGAEHSTGTIRSALMAVPQRGMLYLAKVCAVALTALGVSALIVLASFFAAQSGLGAHRVSLGDGGVPQAAVGAVLYLTLISLLAMGITAVLRSSVAGLVILLPLLFLGGTGLGTIPQIRDVVQFLPDQAGLLIMHLNVPDDPQQLGRDYGPWTGLGIMAAWTLAALLAGAFTLRRRDA